MKIHVPNYAQASGPTFSSNVTIPVPNLPIYLYDYSLECDEGGACRIEWHLTSMKPSSVTARVLQLQGRFYVFSPSAEYRLTYLFDTNDELYRTFAPSLQFAPFPSGEFTVEGSDGTYNASDYWTYEVQGNRITLTFQPSLDMLLQGKTIFYDITL